MFRVSKDVATIKKDASKLNVLIEVQLSENQSFSGFKSQF